MVLSYDINLLTSYLKATVITTIQEKFDRVNYFFTFEDHAQSSHGNSPFLFYNGQQWTYKEAYDVVLKYGTWLKTRHHVKPREIVAMDFMNSQNFVFIWLALWSIGATPAFINYNLTSEPLMHCVKVSEARLMLVDPELKAAVTPEIIDRMSGDDFRGEGKRGVQVVFFEPALEAEALRTTGIREPDSVRAGDAANGIAILIYTSGTTGLPKPAIVSWSKISVGARFCFGWLGWRRKDRLYTVSSSHFFLAAQENPPLR
jgi:acyl-coenzyme A synthetase/AMP-(fatty) acid ligase